MASRRNLVLTTEAARKRGIRDGKAVLVEGAGVVLAMNGERVTIYKEWADGKMELAGQWSLEELRDAGKPETAARPGEAAPARRRTAPALRGTTEDRRRLAAKRAAR